MNHNNSIVYLEFHKFWDGNDKYAYNSRDDFPTIIPNKKRWLYDIVKRININTHILENESDICYNNAEYIRNLHKFQGHKNVLSHKNILNRIANYVENDNIMYKLNMF